MPPRISSVVPGVSGARPRTGALQPLRVLGGEDPDVELRPRLGSDDVGPQAAGDDADVDGDPPFGVCHLIEPLNHSARAPGWRSLLSPDRARSGRRALGS